MRVAIDENRRGGALSGMEESDPDTLELDELIESKIEPGVRLTLMEAPPALLESGHQLSREKQGAFHIDADGRGWVNLPSDFLRLLCFRMSDWERPVFSAISESDPEYELQSSRYKGLRGTPQKPVVAIVRRMEGLALEFYSSKDATATPVQCLYMPEPKIEDGGIDLPRRCYGAIVCRIGALVLATLGDQGNAALVEMSRGLLATED